jgi:hypothetical protein
MNDINNVFTHVLSAIAASGPRSTSPDSSNAVKSTVFLLQLQFPMIQSISFGQTATQSLVSIHTTER